MISNKLVDSHFQRNASSKKVFFLWAALGSGRVVEDSHVEAQLRQVMNLYYTKGIPLLIIAAFICGFQQSMNSFQLLMFVMIFIHSFLFFRIRPLLQPLKASS